MSGFKQMAMTKNAGLFSNFKNPIPIWWEFIKRVFPIIEIKAIGALNSRMKYDEDPKKITPTFLPS
jgi:hypothetical protein